MAGIREQKKARTKKAILAAAVKLFSHKGYEETSIQDLAHAAGIGKSTVYTYFRAKEEIFLAFCEEELDYSFAKLQSEQVKDEPLIEELLRLFLIQFQFVTENREFGRILLRETCFPKQVIAKAYETDQLYIDALNRILDRAKARGEIRRDLDNFFLSAHFYMLYLGSLTGFYTGYVSNLDEVESGLRTLLQHVIEGIA